MYPATCPAPLRLVPTTCQDEKEAEPHNDRHTSPAAHDRKGRQAGNALMRRSIASWNAFSPLPPGCRTVSSSSWRRFSAASTNSKSSEDMRMSVLLEDYGTTPEFGPPLLERCDLRARESIPHNNPEAEPALHRSSSGLYIANTRRTFPRIQPRLPVRTSSTSSWTTARSASSSQSDTLPTINFQKQMVRPASTSSLLTAGLNESSQKQQGVVPPKIAMEKIAKELGLEKMKIEDLPEDAFETDSEDDD